MGESANLMDQVHLIPLVCKYHVAYSRASDPMDDW